MHPRFERIAENVMAGNRGPARRGGHKARQNSHRGALARSVRPEEADNLPFADLKTQVADCGHSGIFFRKLFYFDHLNHWAKVPTARRPRRDRATQLSPPYRWTRTFV